MNQASKWVIAALSAVVLIQAIIIFKVWPAEYYYTKMGQFPVRIRHADQRTEFWTPNGGWRENSSMPPNTGGGE